MISAEKAKDIKRRYDAHEAWMKKTGKRSYYPHEVPAHAKAPSNDEISKLEVYQFVTDPPDKYFLYIDEKRGKATTFTGDVLGDVGFGSSYRSPMGDTRVPVRVYAINKNTYSGTYFKSAGDYARVKKIKGRSRKRSA